MNLPIGKTTRALRSRLAYTAVFAGRILLGAALSFGAPAFAANPKIALVSAQSSTAFASGKRPTVIVVLRSDAAAIAARFGKSAIALGGPAIDSDQELAARADDFAVQKQEVWSTLATDAIAIQRDYTNLPMSFVEVRDQAALDALAAHPSVEGVYPDEIKYRKLTRSLPLIGQPEAQAQGRAGAGTAVAVIDSGIELTNGAFGACTAPSVPASCSIVEDKSFLPTGTAVETDHSHGTNVAGIVIGVAPATKILALNVFKLDSGASDTSIMAAIDFVIANRTKYNIVAVNMSLGGEANNRSLVTGGPYAVAFARLRSAGILPVVASGNEKRIDGMSSPAAVVGAVSVGAVYSASFGRQRWSTCTDAAPFADLVTCFSNSASFLTMLAPGALITAANIQQGGTSQASPHVAGAVAVLRQAFPAESLEMTVGRLRAGPKVVDKRNELEIPRLSLPAALAASPVLLPTLNVGRQGLGDGKVTSKDGKIACTPKCTLELQPGTSAILTAVANSGASFAGWSGAGCTGTGTCTVTVNVSTIVIATFNLQGATPPANDNFANRIVLTGASVTASASNTSATREAGEPEHNGNGGGKSLWWTWTAPFTGTVSIDTRGSVSDTPDQPFDTVLGVYTGNRVDALTEIASNDDAPDGVIGADLWSKVTFAVVAGQAYQIAVDGFDGDFGSVAFTLTKLTATSSVASATMTSSQNPATVGQGITLTATFTGLEATNTGTAVFRETITTTSATTSSTTTVTLCDNVLITNRVATCSVPAANRAAGAHAYSVRYQETGNTVSATGALVQLVSATGTAVTLTALPIRPSAGQLLTLTALVNGVKPSGTVRFRDGANDVTNCSSVALSGLPLATGSTAGAFRNAVATCTVAAIAAGSRNYTASYSGDTTNTASQAALSFEVVALGPLDYSDLWWAGNSENGWGMTIMQKGAVQFNAFYVYDNAGNPIWYVMPGGSWNANFTAFSGGLFQTTSSPYNAYDTTKFTVLPTVGTATLTFTSASAATFDFTINGQTGRKQIARQPFGSTDPAARLVIRDLWWGGSNENGWGLSIAQQDRTVFAVWFTYDGTGKPTWYVMPGGTWDENVFTGALYNTTSSPWLGATYDPTKFRVNAVGTMSLNFTDQDNVVMSYTINGITQSKVITRQPY